MSGHDSREDDPPKKPPTQIKKSLHKQFAQTLLSVSYFILKGQGGQFVQTVPKLFAQTVCANCFYLGGWFFGWVVFPSMMVSGVLGWGGVGGKRWNRGRGGRERSWFCDLSTH